MATISLPYKRVPADESKYGKGYSLNSLTKAQFSSFNVKLLGLGDIDRRSEYRHALAAFFDLQNFTQFTNQVDSHLVVPVFLKRYLTWLFTKIAEVFKESETESVVRIWGSLPFYAKFLGDGILFIWDTEYSGGENGIRNIVKRLHTLTIDYKKELLPDLQKLVSNPPPLVRCGVARGQIMSVGGGNDYVGSCLNIAARLQKIATMSFAVSRRGIDLSNKVYWEKNVILKKVELRGIGKEELIYFLKSEYVSLSVKDKRLFKDP